MSERTVEQMCRDLLEALPNKVTFSWFDIGNMASELSKILKQNREAENTALADRIKVLEADKKRLLELAENYHERLQDQAVEIERIEKHLACYDALEVTRHEKMERLEAERAEVLAFVESCAKSCECDCAVVSHDQHQDGCKEWLAEKARALIAKMEGPQV